MRDCNRLVTLTPITEYLWFMMKKREEYKLYSPVGVGFSVLGLSKWMVARHWTQLKEKYGDDVRVIKQTRHLHFKLHDHNLYADIEEDLKEKRKLTLPAPGESVLGKPGESLKHWFSDIFDLSSLPNSPPCSDQSHRKCFGYMKLENKGKTFDYFVAPVVKGYFEQIGETAKLH